MSTLSRMDSLRSLVRAFLSQQGVAETTPVRESILIRQGCYCGRRFECDGLSAVWFEEEDELKLYHRDGLVAVALKQPLATDARVMSEPTIVPLRRPDGNTPIEHRRAA